MAVPLTLSSTGPSVATTGSLGPSPATALPFDMPSTGLLRSSPRKAFAHYVPGHPLSYDNLPADRDYYQRNYLSPHGEGGANAGIGGFLRDRPMPRPVRPEANWRLLDMESEVRTAIASGLDGFTVVLYALGDTQNHHWQNTQLLMQAASRVDPGFKIMPQPDLTSAVAGKPIPTIAKYLNDLMNYPSAYRLADGRYVLSAFTAERMSITWWTQLLTTMRTTYGKHIAFFPVLQNEMVYAPIFAPITYAIGNWGVKNPAWNNPLLTNPTGPLGRIAAVHALGQKWAQPISVQDQRPREGLFEEAENTTNLRYTWELALRGNAEFVHYTTWGDYPESTVMAPTPKHGWSFLDISAYYLTQWKTGVAPTIVRDTVYLTHRTQFVAARPSFPQTKLMYPRPGTSTPRDTVEALTFLTAPGNVTINVGGRTHSCAVPAGPATCTMPLGIGTPSATVTRGGSTVASVTSPHAVTGTPYIQDLQYVAASSGREGFSTGPARAAVPDSPVTAAAETAAAPAAAAAVPAAPTAATAADQARQTTTSNQALTTVIRRGATTTMRIPAVGDSFVSAAAPTKNFGASSSLASQGKAPYVSYLRFAMPPTPKGKRLTKAVLRLQTKPGAAAGSKSVHRVRLTRTRWSAKTVTWNTRPLLKALVVGTVTSAAQPNTPYSTSLSVRQLRQLRPGNRTLAVTGTGGDALWFWSRNTAELSDRPLLILTYR